MKKYSIIILANQTSNTQRDNEENFDLIKTSPDHLLELIEEYEDVPEKIIVIDENSLTEKLEVALIRSEYKILKTKRRTRGALATAALSLDLVNEEDPIVILPSNAKVNFDITKFVGEMELGGYVAGIVTLNSDSPRMSYVRSYENTIVEIAEKRVIGTEATAGIFYFSDRRSLVDSIAWALVNQVTTNGNFYIAPALNYFLTQRLPIGRYKIGDEQYTRIEN
jgi:hypothetical protein